MGVLLVVAMVLSLLPVFVLTAPANAAGGTTSLTVTKYDAHGNILGTQTVTYQWMEANLPVQGDGATRYYCQGPTLDPNNLWDPAEDVNVESRDYGRPKGTDVKDLCNLVGGASPGDTIRIKAADNWAKWFDYGNVYNPQPRQGKMVICWYNTDYGGYVPTYDTGMRLLFFADTSTNPNGCHVFGDWDMHETLPKSRWYYYYNNSDGILYPSSSGLSGQIVSNIDIYQPNLISCDASGNAKESFASGATVYVKGLGLAKSTSYKLWIQPEPVVANDMLNPGSDPSGAQESVTTDGNGDFGPTAIWSISPSASTPAKYDIIADSQATGTIGKFESADFIDSPGFQGFVAPPPQWDLNKDGLINISDVVVIGLHWGQTGAHGWIPQDLNNDGVINIGDVVVIGLHWGETW